MREAFACELKSGTSRLNAILLFWYVYIALGTLTRVGLLVFNGDGSIISVGNLAGVFLLGCFYDALVGFFWCLPLLIVYVLAPNNKIGRWAMTLLLGLAGLVFIPFWLFTHAAEFVFWNEFSSRFNFIAVDYLMFTREVIGNIQESYNLLPVWLGIGFSTLAILLLIRKPLLRNMNGYSPRFGRRLALVSVVTLGVMTGFVLTRTEWKHALGQPQLEQLAGNGEWEFLYACRTNEIEYERFYKTIDAKEAKSLLQEEFATQPGNHITADQDSPNPVVREIRSTGTEQYPNVILVSIESFGAEFIESLGGKPGLTPEFEKLAKESLSFNHLYATGIRTVRGLEALTLSIPPTPGRSVIVRPENDEMFTIGGVFREKGYQTCYLYGGYSYFDHMNAFFSGNGYEVIDRTDIPDEDIHHETIWGVADEDLFSKTVSVMDKRTAGAEPVFLHVMTTSNHRPYTYPEGRIDIPSGTGRDGAVKYTDYAIGKFIRDARQHDWFDDTMFVFVADHTSNGRNRTDLPLERFHIPMIVYAPGMIDPGVVATPASQIDVAPTILGLLNFNYTSEFYGRDILRDGIQDPHIFMANYQTVGFLDGDFLAELRPNYVARVVDPITYEDVPADPESEHALMEGIAFFQTVAHEFTTQQKPNHASRIKPLALQFLW